MREIKFRVFDKYRDRYIVKNGIGIGSLNLPNNWENFFILEQYTGVKGVNGKEIYEGDILSTPWKHMRTNNTKHYNYPVVYTGGNPLCSTLDPHFTFEWWDKLDRANEYRKIPLMKHCEVIGNIYENKELISE